MKGYKKMERARASKGATSWSRRDSGQITIVVALALGTFLLGFVGFGADMTNLWFHRQSAQNAADSACLAGAMDMLYAANQGTPGAATGGLVAGLSPFTPGTPFDCGSGAGAGSGTHLPNSVPCKYAKLNGYNGTGFPGNAQREGNQVSVSFPATIPGVTAPSAADAGTYPFMRVDVLDRVKVYFSAVLGGSGVQDVVATAKCGLQGGLAPVPLLVLNPTAASAFSLGGTAHVTIAGGPSRSIQVNSNNATAAGVSNNPQIDLTAGGPNFNGSSFGVTGGPGTAPIGFFTNPPAGWQSATAPIPDPFRKLAPPTVPATVPVKTGILPLVDGCPVGLGLTCIEYAPGTYPTGITVSSGTAPCPASGTCYALFAPGVYYLGGDLTLWSGSMVRPTDPNALLHNSPPFGKGDGSMGTTFYFQNGAKINVGANSGASAGCLPLSPTATINCFDTSKALCPSQLAFDSRLNIPAYVDGNVFLGPCTKYGTYPGASVNGNVDAVGTNRGMLFFQDHSKAAAPQFHGSGAFLLNGSMYFHSTDYQTSIGMWGGTGSGTQLVGLIVVDKLNMSGNSTIFMDLSPMPFNGLSVALLQ